MINAYYLFILLQYRKDECWIPRYGYEDSYSSQHMAQTWTYPILCPSETGFMNTRAISQSPQGLRLSRLSLTQSLENIGLDGLSHDST